MFSDILELKADLNLIDKKISLREDASLSVVKNE